MIEGVIFDMDGLMFDTEYLTLLAFQEAAESIGCPVPPAEEFTKNFGKKLSVVKAHIDEIIDYPNAGDYFIRYREKYLIRAAEEKNIPLKKGLLQLLDFLEKQGIPKTIASSSTREMIEANLNATETSLYFNDVVSGEEITRGKPEPEIFLKAAELLEADPENCIVLEDSLNGIEAAYRGRMIPIMVPDMVDPDESARKRAAYIVPSLDKVIPIISRNNGKS